MADVSNPRDLPIGELIKNLSEETSTLVRKELELARAEVTGKAKKAGVGVAGLGGAGILALYALAALTACAIAALALRLPVWAAALVVAAVYAAGAGTLAMLGRRQLVQATPPKPEQAIDSVKEDVEWAKTRMSSGSR